MTKDEQMRLRMCVRLCLLVCTVCACVCVSRMKQEAWMRCMKSPGNAVLKHKYENLKAQYRKGADKAREGWW